MSVHTIEFENWVLARYNQYKWYKTTANPVPPAAAKAELAAIVTALAADATSHDKTIESVAAPLKIHYTQTPFTNDINLLINKGKAGNLPNSAMIAAIDSVVAVPFKPGVNTVPYAYPSATPPIVGTVCTCTTGTWIGTPSSYTYQWKRDGTTNLGTAASYTLIAADIGGHAITCVVTATNAQGSTIAPPSNAIHT